MIFEQFYLNCLAHASYLIGDEKTRTAVVVDPQRDVQRYLEAARRRGLQIRYVFLTHLHADFIAGHLELRDTVGAKICLGARANAEYAFTPMKEGDVLEFGSVRLKILETPGHTPESISLLVYDLEKDDKNQRAVLTGDTLFVGEVGRPDLRASLGWQPADLARLLYASLGRKLLNLPDSTLVYPAHGAGSLCGRNISSETFSTIGEQRRSNYALQPMSEEAFVGMVTADQPDAPAYFTHDAVLNSKERPTLEATLQRVLNALSLETVVGMKQAGAQVVDARDPDEFAKGHLAGSINIGLGGQYATWAGTLLGRDKPIILIANPGREQESAIRLGRIGFDHIAGYLDGGIEALEARPELVQRTERMVPAMLAEELASSSPFFVLDVRTPREWHSKHIAGSLNIPLNHLGERLAELPSGRKILVHCAGGYRSSIAASILQQNGFGDLSELAGGIAAWEAAKLPVQA
ncbi:MAG TPA: MBL fold metallo-hydrolase [Methylomirabilota bacterium]|nr:MBL fold metallo-hydrolase [Methylomirabilota bacterium]